MVQLISKKIRQNIIQTLIKEDIDWYGDLDDVEFLSRIYELSSIRSTDKRFKGARGDIWQHRINNNDWDKNWIYDDSRFDLYGCPDKEFLNFLSETIHPSVRTPSEVTESLRELYNKELSAAGFKIVQKTSTFGHIYYEVESTESSVIPAVEDLKVIADRLDSNYLRQQILRMVKAVDTDPDLAVGTAKDLVETACKTMLKNRKYAGEIEKDLPDLLHLVLKDTEPLFNLRDDEKTTKSIQKLFGSIATAVQSIAELRNLQGTGHGKESHHTAIESQLASFAVNSAVAVAAFVLSADTSKSRREST